MKTKHQDYFKIHFIGFQDFSHHFFPSLTISYIIKTLIISTQDTTIMFIRHFTTSKSGVLKNLFFLKKICLSSQLFLFERTILYE